MFFALRQGRFEVSYEKTITIYKRIPIDEVIGKVSRTDLTICKVINHFIDQLCVKSDDESIPLLSWDQVLMRVSRTSPISILGELLEKIERELHGDLPPENSSEEWERGYERREILHAEGYIFGDPIFKPYCADGIISWVYSESIALWQQGLLDEMPTIKKKVEFQRTLDKWSAQDELVTELLVAKTGEGLPERRIIKRLSGLISVIEGYGVLVQEFRPGRSFVSKHGEKMIVTLDQLHNACVNDCIKGLMPLHYPTWKTEVWDEFNKIKKYYKSIT